MSREGPQSLHGVSMCSPPSVDLSRRAVCDERAASVLYNDTSCQLLAFHPRIHAQHGVRCIAYVWVLSYLINATGCLCKYAVRAQHVTGRHEKKIQKQEKITLFCRASLDISISLDPFLLTADIGSIHNSIVRYVTIFKNIFSFARKTNVTGKSWNKRTTRYLNFVNPRIKDVVAFKYCTSKSGQKMNGL